MPCGDEGACGAGILCNAGTCDSAELITQVFNGNTYTLTISPASLTVGATATLTLSVKDSGNHPLVGQPITITGGGSNVVYTPAPTAPATSPSGSTNSSGNFSVQISSTTPQTLNITAVSGPYQLTGTLPIAVGAPALAQSSITVAPGPFPANGTTSASIAVVVKDTYGNPVPNHTVNLTSTGTNNTITPATGTTDQTGTFAAVITSTRAGLKTITAAVPTVFNLTGSTTFTAGPGLVTVTATPSTQLSNGVTTSTLLLSLKDAQGNPIAGEPVTLAVTTGTATLTPASPSGITDANGNFSGTKIASTVAGSVTITGTDTSTTSPSAGATGTAQLTFTPQAPIASASSLSATPTTLTADGVTTSQITLIARDTNSNVVPGKTVNFAVTGVANGTAFNPASATTDSNGQVQTLMTSTNAGLKNVQATVVSGYQATIPITFVPGAPATATSSVTASPSSVIIGSNAVATLTATAVDATGNAVPGQTVTFSASGTGNTFTPASGTATTNAAGVASVTMVATLAGAQTISAAVGGTALGTSNPVVTFKPGLPATQNCSISVPAGPFTSDGQTPAQIAIVAHDQYNNPVGGATVTLSSYQPTGLVFTPATGTTDQFGNFSATVTSTVYGTKSVLAAVGPNARLSATTSFTAGPPILAIAPNPTSQLVGTVNAAIVVSVKDAQGNPYPAQPVTLQLQGGNPNGSNTFTPAAAGGISSMTTDANGNAQFKLSSTTAEVKTLFGTAPNLTNAGVPVTGTSSITFFADKPTLAASTFKVNPNSGVPDDGVTATAVTFVGIDEYGNPTPGRNVSFAVPGVTTGNTFTPSSGTTDPTGTFTAQMTSTVAGTKTVQATVTNSFQTSAQVTFALGGASANTSTLTAAPASLTANGVAQVTLVATVRDASGNLLPNQTVVFAASNGTGNVFNPANATAVTNAAGVATVTMSSTQAGAVTFGASVGPVIFSNTPAPTATFVPGPPAAATTTLTISPTAVAANGVATVPLTLNVRDAQSNPIPNHVVNLSTHSAGVVFTPATGNTDANGNFSATISSTAAGAKTISVSVPTVLSLSGTANFIAGPPILALVPSPATVVAGPASSTIVLSLLDAQGNPYPNQPVTLQEQGGNPAAVNTFVPAATNGISTATTSSAGTAVFKLASQTAEVKTLLGTATALTNPDGSAVTGATQVTYTAGQPTSSTGTFSISPDNGIADDGVTATTVTITVADSFGNPAPNRTVTFTVPATPTGITFTPASGTTDPTGTFTSQMVSTSAGVKNVQATVTGGYQVYQTATFILGPPDPGHMTFHSSLPTVVADGTHQALITMTVQDATANPIPSATCDFSSTGTGPIFTPNPPNAPDQTVGESTTDSLGRCAVMLSSLYAGDKTITGTVDSIQQTASDLVNFTGGEEIVGTGWPNGSDGPLEVDVNNPVTLYAGQVYDFSSINIAQGGVLTLAGDGFVLVGSAGPVEIDGVIQGTPNGNNNIVHTTNAPANDGTLTGEVISDNFQQASGGTGGNGGTAYVAYGYDNGVGGGGGGGSSTPGGAGAGYNYCTYAGGPGGAAGASFGLAGGGGGSQNQAQPAGGAGDALGVGTGGGGGGGGGIWQHYPYSCDNHTCGSYSCNPYGCGCSTCYNTCYYICTCYGDQYGSGGGGAGGGAAGAPGQLLYLKSLASVNGSGTINLSAGNGGDGASGGSGNNVWGLGGGGGGAGSGGGGTGGSMIVRMYENATFSPSITINLSGGSPGNPGSGGAGYYGNGGGAGSSPGTQGAAGLTGNFDVRQFH